MMYCTHTRVRGYRQLDGDLWVCGECMKPSPTVFRKLTNMRAPYGSQGLLSTHGEVDGRFILRWDMGDGQKKETVEFHSYPRKVDMNAGDSLLLRTWELLDSKMDIIMRSNDTEAKQQARGIAETLAILMQPFLTSADDVARHAVKRWKAKQAGEHYEVPGLSEHIWDPTRNWDGSPRTTAATRATSSVKTAPSKQLSAEESASIKAALAAGMFTPAQLADTFKVSVAQIEACR